MYRSLKSFLDNHLPELIAGKPRLRASFISYNHIGRHKTGAIRTDDPTLSVTTHIGNRTWSGPSNVLPVNKTAALYTDMNAARAIIAQQELERTFVVPPAEDGDNTLFFVYAGRLPQFYDVVDFAVGLKRKNPAAKVVVVSCKCQTYEKGHRLVWAIEDNEVAFAVEVDDCGGFESMSAIMDRLIGIWPQRER
ncbi:hypothetical protein ACFLZO_00685 [Patescibacteria group bacterium]